jgi:hypothetical protein
VIQKYTKAYRNAKRIGIDILGSMRNTDFKSTASSCATGRFSSLARVHLVRQGNHGRVYSKAESSRCKPSKRCLRSEQDIDPSGSHLDNYPHLDQQREVLLATRQRKQLPTETDHESFTIHESLSWIHLLEILFIFQHNQLIKHAVGQVVLFTIAQHENVARLARIAYDIKQTTRV